MDRRKLAAGAFLAAGVVFLFVASTDQGQMSAFLGLGIVFLVLGAAQLRRARGR